MTLLTMEALLGSFKTLPLNEQDAQGFVVIEQSGMVEVLAFVVGIFRLWQLLLLAKWPFLKGDKEGKQRTLFGPLSESAVSVAAGDAVPAARCGCIPMSEVFKSGVTSITVVDWGLFGAAV